MRLLAFLLCTVTASASAQPKPGLKISVVGGPTVAATNPKACDTHESPDAPARALHLADGSVQLYATDQDNQLITGPDLRHLSQNCDIIYRGSHSDDPAAFDDRSWLATPWTADGKTVWAIVHDEFHGNLRKQLCPTGRYMDCWYNALTLAVSTDGGRHFERVVPPSLVAALPYRYDEVGLGHHGYFNPSNIVSRDGGLYMFMFATKSGAQAEGNCLMRSDTIDKATAWRAWDGRHFSVRFIDPYRDPEPPEQHVCTPVGVGALRWPVTSLARHSSTGLYVAVMQDTERVGGVYYATSGNLIDWSSPARLMPATGIGGWVCGDATPIAYPSLLDPASADRNFETIGDQPELFVTQFNVDACHRGSKRTLVQWQLLLSAN